MKTPGILSSMLILCATLVVSCNGMNETPKGERQEDAVNKPTSERTEAEWQHCLSPSQYRVLRQKGTEAPWTGKLLHVKESGTFVCAACGAPLFDSADKFDSGTGWPSFMKPRVGDAIGTSTDRSLGMERIEVHCNSCGSHLGHVFPDGPGPSGERFCINSVSLDFEPESNAVATVQTETATFGIGCFWCGEAVFERLPGVMSVTSGFMGGNAPNPSYKDVCAGDTGHAEVVQIMFDPSVTSYDKLLETFWAAHDPTTLNRQGADVGTQYRSAIFYHNDEQRRVAEASKAHASTSGDSGDPIVTQIVPASEFYPADDDHQDYYNNNTKAPYCRMVIAPKLKKLGLE